MRETEAIVRAISAYPGVVDVITLVDEPGSFILSIGLNRNRTGWETLELLAWALNGYWKKGIGDVILYPHSIHPPVNKDSLSFILSGKPNDPADAINIALHLSEVYPGWV